MGARKTERQRKTAKDAAAFLRERRERFLRANKQMRDAAENAIQTIMTPGRRRSRIESAVREVRAAARFQCAMLKEYGP